MSEEDEVETKVDELIEVIFDLLPATSYEEIATGATRKLRRPISVGLVNNAIARLRSNSAHYAWTIPHVKRGNAKESDEGRYIALLVDRDGHYELDQNPDASRHIYNGIGGTIQQTATMMGNATAAIEIAATHTRSVNARNKLKDLAADFDYLSRKAAALVREMAAA
jgi:hypothetical protein